MNKIKSTLILIFLATTGCSSSISDLEDKIEAQAVKNNVEISYAEIKKTAIYLDAWSKEDFYQEAIDKFREEDKATPPPEDLILFTGSSSIRFWGSLRKICLLKLY